MAKRMELDAGKIAELYLSGKTATKIGKIFGVSKKPILRHLKLYNIPLRGRPRPDLDADKIISLYQVDLLTLREIAGLFGVSIGAIRLRLQEKNVPCRNCSESHSLKDGVIMGAATYRNKEWLTEHYVDKEMSLQQVANICGVCADTIHIWVRKYGIKCRTLTDYGRLRANHFIPNNDFNDFITGLLLGDGCLTSGSRVSATYIHGSKHYSYLEDLKEQFLSFGIEAPAKIHTKEGITKGHKFIGYSFATLSYAELRPIWKIWYPNNKKILPGDIELTPTTCLHWYLGDGGLRNSESKEGGPSISLSTHCFAKQDVLRLIGKLEELGTSASYWPSCNSIGIGVEDTPKFLDYIGPCPDGAFSSYGYRWDLGRSKKQWEAEFGNGTIA